jgi:hypothetical protein
MKISWLLVGRTDFDFVKEGVREYAERITKYAPFSISFLEGLKKTQSLRPSRSNKRRARSS